MCRFIACLAPLLIVLAVATVRAADDKPAPKPEARVAAAVCVTETATLLRREAPGKAWQVVKGGEEIFSGDQLLGGFAGAVDTRDGSVRLALVGDLDGTAPL